MKHKISTLLLLVVSLSACAEQEEPAREWTWDLPQGAPHPPVPASNPLTAPKVELGRHLFYDKRLSGNQTMSCASCHKQEAAFTDGRAVAEGSTGQLHTRNAMSLTNVAYNASQGWASPELIHLEEQILVPLLGTDPVELGMKGLEEELLVRLADEPRYAGLFEDAFPDKPQPSLEHIVQAIASFERTLLSFDSPYDRYIQGDSQALSMEAYRGMELFFSEQTECFHCHGGFNFSDAVDHQGVRFDQRAFHNNGLYTEAQWQTRDAGLYKATGQAQDMGRFRAPTLRNIAQTGPYMHDGSIETLEEVIEHYARGGSRDPSQSPFVGGFIMTPEDKAAMVTFLRSLSDEAFLINPAFSDPWAAP